MAGGGDTVVRARSQFERIFEPGEVVFREGDRGDHLYVIVSGEVELAREETSGQRVVARFGPGDFFGEVSLVEDEATTAHAVVIQRARVLELDRPTLESMCLEQPEIAIRMIRTLVSRLLGAERRLAALGIDDLLRPVVRVLVRRAEPVDEGGICIPVTLRQLAEASGLSLPDTHRVLHQLFDRRVLELVDDRLVASDLDSLAGCLDTA